MNNAIGKMSRLSVLCLALFVTWCGSLALSVYLAHAASASAAVCQKNQELAGILAPDLAAVRSYHGAVNTLRDSAKPQTTTLPFRDFVDKHFPQSQADSYEERTQILPSSKLNLATVTAKWGQIETTVLSRLIAAAETNDTPFRLASLTITPSPRAGFVQAEASFTAY